MSNDSTTPTAGHNGAPTDGRLMGLLAILMSPGALLVSPTWFSLGGFFVGLLGLTVAAPQQRFLSVIGIVLAGMGGAIGYYFNTPIV